MAIFLLIYYFLKNILLIFTGHSEAEREGETERKIFCPLIQSPSKRNGRCYADPKPEVSSGSPTRAQGSKALGLLSQATSRELDGKWGCWD